MDWENFVLGQYLRPVIYGLHDATGSVLFGKERKGTTIQGAYHEVNEADPLRSVVRLEKGHQPALMENASLLMIVTMMARTGTEITYRGGKLVVVTASSIYSLASQSPREWAWKTKLLGKKLTKTISRDPGMSEKWKYFLEKEGFTDQ